MFSSNDDDDLFTPSASSNLANLFGAVVSSTTDLKYTAPRQPKNDNSDLKDSIVVPQVSVICAKVVITRKFVDSSYQDLGKYGFAIIGNQDFIKEMLLYKDKQHVIAKITVCENFNIFHVDTDVLRFSDDQGVRWETKFIKTEEFLDFVKILKSRNIEIVDKLPKKEVIEKIIPDNPKEQFDNQTRTDILTRMAKMGQSVLPGKLVKTSTGSDSETDDNTVSKRKPVVKKKPSHFSNVISHSEGPSETNPPVLYQMQAYNYQQPQILPHSLNMSYPNQEFNFFISENRTHNSEVRINLTTISGKIDTILNEIYRIKAPPNTDRLENEFLKSKIIDLESKLSKSNEPSLDLSLKLKELENLLVSKNTRISELEEANQMLEGSLKEATTVQGNNEELKLENESFLNKVNELNLKIESIEEEAARTQQNFKQLHDLHDNITEENKRLLEVNKKLKGELENKVKESSTNNVNPSEIKEIMNSMFQNILQDVNETHDPTDNSYKEIKSSLAKHLKTATFAMIDKLQMD